MKMGDSAVNIEIINPKEDQNGNIKENIFLAFDDRANYLGYAYAYPNIKFHETYETPYTIFIDINIENNVDKPLINEVKQKLFDKVFLRAKELRIQRPDLKSRIYTGFEYDKYKMDFYIKNGFDEDYGVIMEATIPKTSKYTLPKNIEVNELAFNTDKELIEYKKMHDNIFITPMDIDVFKEQEKQRFFKNLSFSMDGKIIGGCTIFEKDGFGFIECLYIFEDYRGKGMSKIIINYIFNYFLSNELYKAQLEAWELNKRAINLYKSFGFIEVKKKLMFPGITL